MTHKNAVDKERDVTALLSTHLLADLGVLCVLSLRRLSQL